MSSANSFARLGVKCLRLPAQSPNLNAFAERFVLSSKCECLDKLVLLGERHLHLAVAEYLEHYHVERNHQGLDNPTDHDDDDLPGRDASQRQLSGGPS